jgi:1,4-alpha-glucan branching enzyme
MLFQGQEFLEDEWFRDDVPLDWAREEAFGDIVRLARDLIALRRDTSGTTVGLTGPHTWVLHLDDTAKTLAWARATDDQAVAVVVNASANAADIETDLPRPGQWAVQFNSDAATYSALFGDHQTLAVDTTPEGRATVSVGPYSLVVLSPV